MRIGSIGSAGKSALEPCPVLLSGGTGPRKLLLLAAAAAVLLSVSALAASGALSGILGYLHQRSGGLTLDQETVIQQDTAPARQVRC